MATTTTTDAPPPLEAILPYIISGLSAAATVTSGLITLTKTVLSLVSRSIGFFSPLPIILYLFAPLIVFLDIVTDIFIRWPRSAALYLLDAFYPIYVFFGVACIVGLLIGGTGRLLTIFLVDMVERKGERAPDAEEEVEVKEERPERKSWRPKREEEDSN